MAGELVKIEARPCRWWEPHVWSTWDKVAVKNSVGVLVDVNQRKCQRCGYTDRRMV